jgi:ketosteroid isomerase-like protein
MSRTIAALLSLGLAATLAAQDTVPAELRSLADAERAFARTATQKGIRDSFLDFFADDAIALVPDAAPAKDRLRARPSVPFAENELLWEPRIGDVAASGELGWLTGPSTFTNKKVNGPPSYGNYLSVWRKGADGVWKVFIDIGSDAPAAVPFPPGFTRFPFPSRYAKPQDKAAATKALLDADRALNRDLSSRSSADAYAPAMAPDVRLHRDGMAAVTGRRPAVDWLAKNSPSLRASTTTAESARSAELGYSYGTYQKGDGPARGPYLRIWSRTADGTWLIVAEVMPTPR